jgi:hypothetical protein
MAGAPREVVLEGPRWPPLLLEMWEKGAGGQSWGGSDFCSGAVWKKPTERGR